jgi:hypothetical protein
VITNLVRLYKSLGGGWKSFEMDPDKPENVTKEKQEAK